MKLISQLFFSFLLTASLLATQVAAKRKTTLAFSRSSNFSHFLPSGEPPHALQRAHQSPPLDLSEDESYTWQLHSKIFGSRLFATMTSAATLSLEASHRQTLQVPKLLENELPLAPTIGCTEYKKGQQLGESVS